MHTIKQNWTRWVILVAIAASLFFGGLAMRLRMLPDGIYIKAVGFLMMFLGIVLFGTLLTVFVLKYIKAGDKPK